MISNAEKIGSDYFDPRLYSQNYKSDIIVEMVRINYDNNFEPDYVKVLDNVVDYSYDCKVDSEVRQSATLTLYQPKDDNTWYFRRQHLAYEGFDPITHRYSSTPWMNNLYHLVKRYIFQNGSVQELDLGYFVVTDSGYNYDSTTSTLTLTLAGLTARYQAEYGGVLTTTRLGCYVPDDQITAQISAIRSQIRTGEISAVVGQARINQIYEKLRKGEGKIEIQFPMAISIEKDESVGEKLFEKYLIYRKKSEYFRTSMMEPPVRGIAIYGLDVYNTPKLYEFDNGVACSEIINTILSDCMQNYCYYIDEDFILHMRRKSPTQYGTCRMKFRDYQMLVIDENTDGSDSNFYNYIEVYGKDGSYYGYADWSAYDGGQIRDNVMTFSELQTDDECVARARWEVYKSRYGHETTTITLADNYIPEFMYPSNFVGSIIEYRTMHGDIHAYNVTGLSYSNHRWTLNLQVFRPLYLDIKTDDIEEGSQVQRDAMLAKPVIAKTEFVDNHIIRLYVTGEDIEYGLVKLFNHGGDIGETVKEETIGDTIYKVFDFPINQNGLFLFTAQLYNPRCENSLMSDAFEVNITDYIEPEPIIPDDPYPHPKMDMTTYYLTTNDGQMLITNDDRNLITERK